MKKVVVFILTLALIMCCACSSGTNGGEQGGATVTGTIQNADSMSIGVYNFDTYNPIATVSQSVTQASALVFDSLVRRTGNQSIEPRLCSSYSISGDGLTYTFNLKDGVHWHDGSLFSAADVDYTFRMIGEIEQCSYKSRLDNVQTYRRAGGDTFVITLKRADAGFINLLDIPIIKSGTDCKNGLKEYVPIGTGAYKYVPSDLSRAMRLVRNEDYIVGTKPLISEIIVKQLPQRDSLASALEAREIEAASFTATEMRNYNPKGNLSTVSYSNGMLTFIGVNTTAGALVTSQMRRAISYAIDREEIRKNVFFGRAQSVCVPASPESYLFKNIYKLERDNERAAELLAEAGYTPDAAGIMVDENGGKLLLELIVNAENELRTAAAEKIKSDLNQIGIELNVKSLPFAEYEARIKSGKYELFLGETKIGVDLNLSMLAGNSASYSIYSSERIDALLESCRTATNAEIYENSYNELEEVFLSEMPIISLVMGTDALVLNSKIKGALPPSDGNVFANVDAWYIEK